MTDADPDPVRAARRLLRWYPRSWRDRYGEEFAELLLADLQDRPRSFRRGLDIAGHGLLARLAVAGLTARGQSAATRLAALGGELGLVALLGAAMLAQLATGWQWASPPSASVAGATMIMTLAAGCAALTGVAGLVPVLWQIARAARRRDRPVRRPAFVAAGCAAALLAGARHFANSWPGTGGTGASHHLVPGGLAAFSWASTLSVSSFWAHPSLLARFPAAELAWMAASPVAGTVLLVAAGTAVRRLELPPGLIRYLSRVACAGSAAAAVFLAGAVVWLVGDGGGATLFRPGLLDCAELVIMALALALAVRQTRGLSRTGPVTAG